MEIIVCISLLAIIAVLVIVFNVNNDENKKKEKLIRDIKAAADVYSSINNDIVEKAKDNYGYYVLTIKELREMGILDINQIIPTLSDEEASSVNGYDYNKIVLNINDENNIGEIDYIYPFYLNEEKIMNLDTIHLETFEKDLFECNSLLKDDYNSDVDYLLYLDKNYEKHKSTLYTCSTTLNIGENNIEYKLTDNGLKGIRSVHVNQAFNPSIKAISNGEVYNCGVDFTNGNVTLSLVDNGITIDENNERVINDKLDILLSGDKNDSGQATYTVSDKGKYKLKYSLSGILGGFLNGETIECEVKIDKIAPIISNLNGNKILIEDKQEDGTLGSGGIKYKINNGSWINYPSTGVILSTLDLQNGVTIRAKDKLGNESTKTIEGSYTYPSIEYEPVKDSITKFKVTIKNISNNSNYDIDKNSIRVQYEFDRDKYKYYEDNFKGSSKMTTNNLNTFQNNFNYSSDLNTISSSALDEFYSYNEAYKLRYEKSISSSQIIKPNIYYVSEKKSNYDSTLRIYNPNVLDIQDVKDNAGKVVGYSFVIDMFDLINYCSHSYNKYCPKIIDYSDLENLSLNYNIFVKNNSGKSNNLKLNSKLNWFIDTKAYVHEQGAYYGASDNNRMTYDKIGDYRGQSSILGINSNGDILFEYCKNGDRSYTWDYNRTCYIYYHNNLNNKNYYLGNYDKKGGSDSYSGYADYKAYFTEFTTDKIEYYECSDGMKMTFGGGNYYWYDYTFYRYNILKNTKSKIKSDEDEYNYHGQSSYIREKYSCTNFINTSNSLFNYQTITLSSVPSYSVIDSFLNQYRYWYKYRYDSSRSYYYDLDSLLGNRIMYRDINDKKWSYILMSYQDYYDNIYRYNFYFLPEVTLSHIKTTYGR